MAISYVWGYEFDRRNIVVESELVLVSANLVKALSAIRS
jgi:hypothetical protein